MKRQLIISLVIVTLAAIMILEVVTPVAQALGQMATSEVADPAARSRMEASILNATVRYHIQSWILAEDESGYLVQDSVGHGTVMGGRYLVTHNHIEIPLSIRSRAGDQESSGTITFFNTSGAKVYTASLAEFELVREETEALVFAAKDASLFGKLGFSSASFKDYGSVELKPGMTVAQIDWDGETTRVDWTTVREVTLDDGVARLVLDDGAMRGASGGGIFYQGNHVANNWRLEERVGANGDVLDAVTTVALNTTEVVGS